jgi:hypothetical protein
MDQRTRPSPRLQPLPPEATPELREQFDTMRKNLGFVPNSILIMQRKPRMAKAFAAPAAQESPEAAGHWGPSSSTVFETENTSPQRPRGLRKGVS